MRVSVRRAAERLDFNHQAATTSTYRRALVGQQAGVVGGLDRVECVGRGLEAGQRRACGAVELVAGRHRKVDGAEARIAQVAALVDQEARELAVQLIVGQVHRAVWGWGGFVGVVVEGGGEGVESSQ